MLPWAVEVMTLVRYVQALTFAGILYSREWRRMIGFARKSRDTGQIKMGDRYPLEHHTSNNPYSYHADRIIPQDTRRGVILYILEVFYADA